LKSGEDQVIFEMRIPLVERDRLGIEVGLEHWTLS
jgi:hypothetical protein